MTTQERALKIIALINAWKPGDPSNLREASLTGKAAMIARWGLKGDEIMLREAELQLGVSVDEDDGTGH